MTSPGALERLDALVGAAVESAPANDPPTSPTIGTCYIIGSTPTDDWSQHAQQLAYYSSGGWRFFEPAVGLSVLIKDSGVIATYLPAGWDIGTLRASALHVAGEQVVGVRMAAIPDASGGTVVDVEARAALASILHALRQHGLIKPA